MGVAESRIGHGGRGLETKINGMRLYGLYYLSSNISRPKNLSIKNRFLSV